MALMGALCKIAMLSMCLEDTLAHYMVKGVGGRLQEVPGFPDVRCEAERKLVWRGHLDLQMESLQLLHLSDVMALMSAKDTEKGYDRRRVGSDDPDFVILSEQFLSK